MAQYDFTEEQYMLKDMVKRVADKELRPRLEEIEEIGAPAVIYDTLVKQGLIAMPYPEEYGGGGGSVMDTCILTEELAKVDANSAMLATAHELGATPILIAGTHEQKQKYITPITEEGKYYCFGLTEPDAGSDAAGMKTRAVDKGDYYLVNGTKRFITLSDFSDYMVLFAKTDPDAGIRGISAFIVEMNWPGISLGKHEDKMGFRGLTASEVIFEDVKVPKENLLGKEGSGFKTAMKTLDKTRPIVGIMGVGLAQGSLDFAIQYSKERYQFGQPICANQGYQWMLADMAMRIEAARQLCYKGAALADAEDPQAGLIGSMAKCMGTDAAMQVCTDALQACGGSGYMREYPQEKRMRDAKLLQIVEGTNQIQRVVVSGYLFK